MIKDQISNLLNQSISTKNELYGLKAQILGKTGIINAALKEAAQLPLEAKKTAFQEINNLKTEAETALVKIEQRLHNAQIETMCNQLDSKLNQPTFYQPGSLHPLQSLIADISHFFDQLGFVRVEGTHIARAYHNFDALNTDKHHPSRNSSDTFYLNPEHVLRTHTTASLEANMSHLKPPFKAYCIGPVYRNEDEDSTHTCMFHQIDLVVMSEEGEQFSVSHLKGLVDLLVTGLLQKSNWHWIPSFFPFTQPSFEVYIDQLELLGCGLLHPRILQEQGFEKHTCLALGMGLERILSVQNNFSDIRELYSFDARKRS